VRKVLSRFDPDTVWSVRALLEAEKASGVHRPGGLLTDPSAAMALLWMRRTMSYYIQVLYIYIYIYIIYIYIYIHI